MKRVYLREWRNYIEYIGTAASDLARTNTRADVMDRQLKRAKTAKKSVVRKELFNSVSSYGINE